MDTIKMVDLRSQYLRIKAEINASIENVLESTAFIQGPEVSEFATALSEYVGGAFAIPCANGTDALQIAMMALEFRPGDEIILPVHTYVATAEVVALLGLKPIFVDVDQRTFNIDVRQIEEKITRKTVAIVPVHLYGQCADMESILQVAKKYSLHVIEDAAQSLSAEYLFSDGTRKKAGTIGTIGTTSFFPSKNLGCFGDGGALFTTDVQLAEKIKMIANHGQRLKYQHEIIGINSRLDTLQAAILKVKLKYLDDYTSKRQQVAARYDEALSGLTQVCTPLRSTYSTHVFHQYTLLVNEGSRDNLKESLALNGIPSMVYYPIPLHLQNAYRHFSFPEGSFPVSERLSKIVISLPIHTEMPEEQVEYISDKIKMHFS